MKKSIMKVLSLVLAITLLSACLTAGAELKLNSGSINIHSGIRIDVDGKEFVPVDSDGIPVEVFLYDGTTYLPVRAISNLFGLGIEWDNETKSVYLGSRKGVELPKYTAAADFAASPFKVENKTVTVHTGISIYYNDKYFQPTDSEGFSVETFLYNGTTYLPVRAISTLMNAKIDWDQASKTVLLTTAADKNAEGYEAVVEAATNVATYYGNSSGLVRTYYRYYLNACAILDEGLALAKEEYYAYGSFDGGMSLMKLETYVKAYDGFMKEFGTYTDKCMSLCDLAKTVQGRIEKFAEDGYTAEELDTLTTNTEYLKENRKYFSEYLKQGAPEYMVDYFVACADAFGEAIVLQLCNISIEY